jgi:phosphoserine aminotransferase
MAERVFNFSPGPAVIPDTVLAELQRTVAGIPSLGASPLEVSHRGRWFSEVLAEAKENLHTLLDVPETHAIVFCQGGATQQFSMAPMNLAGRSGSPADFVVTGSWSAKAAAEAERLGPTRIAWTDADAGFARTPTPGELEGSLAPDASYVHVTTNETIYGVEFMDDPSTTAGVPLIADMSSDFLSRPVDVSRYGLIYAGAQKNAGPAGVTIVLVRRDLLERIPDGLPTMLDYRTFVEHDSLYNTPPVFAIYVLMLVTRWLCRDVGGIDAQAAANRTKAATLYEAIDGSDGFYRGHAHPGSRSRMNVTWRLPTPELDAAFVAMAADRGLIELKGHRSVGGIRASIYNAMPPEGVSALATFMAEFRADQA